MRDQHHVKEQMLGRRGRTDEARDLFVKALNLLEPYSETSRLTAGKRIVQIVRDFRQYREWEKHSPRRAELHRLCSELKVWARKGESLFALPDVDTLDFLQRGEDGVGWLQRGEDGVERFDAGELFRAANLETAQLDAEENPQGWAARLQGLGELVRRRRRELERDGVVDRGGGATAFKDRYGSAKHILVKECCWLFAECRPGKATTNEEGEFYSFASMVYEIASGEGGDEEGSGLIRYVRFSVGVLEELEDCNRRLAKIDALLPYTHHFPPEEIRDLNARHGAELARQREIHARWQLGPKDPPRKNRRAP